MREKVYREAGLTVQHVCRLTSVGTREVRNKVDEQKRRGKRRTRNGGELPGERHGSGESTSAVRMREVRSQSAALLAASVWLNSQANHVVT